MTKPTEDAVFVEIRRDLDGSVNIAEYNRTAVALTDLENRYQGVTFEVTTTDGMKAAKTARKELRDLRVKLEKRRKELKAPVLDYTRALDGQAKTITARIEALEDPIDTQVKEEEQRREREKAAAEAAERARIDAHRRVIEEMRNKPLAMIGATAVDLEVAFNEVQATDLSGLEEFASEAALVKDEAAGKLHELWTQAMEREEAAAKEAEAQRQRDAKAAEEKAAREAEQAELEELRRFKAEKEAAEEAKNQAARDSLENISTPAADQWPKEVMDYAATHGHPEELRRDPAHFGFDMASGRDATVTQEVAAQDIEFDVDVEWAGYCRGTATYRVKAATAAEAMERWSDGERIAHDIVRDDTEKEPIAAMVAEEGASC